MNKKIYHIILHIFAIIGFILFIGYFAVKLGLTNTKGMIDNQDSSFLQGTDSNESNWIRSEEWTVLKQAINKDAEAINKAARDASIDPRLIVSILVPEQLRLFHSEREIFKEVFSPLKILGNQSQFSWGIMGIKKDTAIEIENNLKNRNSLFYLGENYQNILDFATKNIGEERFERLVNEKEHYYSYFYTAVYIKEIIAQWKNSGFDISKRPEIIATLFNIGFKNSRPNSTPHSGGSEIKIDNKIYSFGTLAGEFFYSDELIELFPKK
jgi:hypothetical protein